MKCCCIDFSLCFGISGIALKWFPSYLSQQSQSVRVNGILSKDVPRHPATLCLSFAGLDGSNPDKSEFLLIGTPAKLDALAHYFPIDIIGSPVSPYDSRKHLQVGIFV